MTQIGFCKTNFQAQTKTLRTGNKNTQHFRFYAEKSRLGAGLPGAGSRLLGAARVLEPDREMLRSRGQEETGAGVTGARGGSGVQ